MSDSNQNSTFSNNSRFNFVAIMLGMTVCFSTLWRFPYQVASFGGLAYIAIYLIMLIFFVYPALTAEWGLGRFTNSGPEKAYDILKLPKSISYVLFFIVFAIGSYFIVWIGWILLYGFKAITDPTLVNPSTSSTNYFLTNIVNQPVIQLLFAVFVLVLLAPTLLGGVKVIEKVNKVIVPFFYAFLTLLTVFLLIQPGILPAIFSFLGSTNIQEQITPFTFVAALGQAFFSLCLGGTYMVLYSSYSQRTEKHDIPINAGLAIFGNTLASFLSIFLVFGIIVYSSLGLANFHSFGLGLFFSVIPQAFQNIPLPTLSVQILLALFFVLFFLSAYMPMVAVLEVLIAFIVKKFNLPRSKAFIGLCIPLLIASIPSILSPLEGGFLYNLDIFIGALGSVVGSIIALYAFGWKITKKEALAVINEKSKFTLGNFYYFMMKYVSPFVMIFVIVYGLADVIVGYFPPNAIPESNYIFYPTIVALIPLAGILILAIIFVTYYITEKHLNKTQLH